MDDTIVVTGGTGRIGRSVVPLLRAADRNVRMVSRHEPDVAPADAGITHVVADAVEDQGLTAAFAGAGTILHLAGSQKGDDRAAVNVARAAREAGTRHLILISVIGAGRMPIGYFRAKAEAERAVAESGVPWSILAAAQLHEFLLPMVRGLSRLPVTLAPKGLRFEPVHREEVAERLVEIALGAPAGRVPELAGPEVLELGELVSQYSGRRRPLLRIRVPGAIGRAYRAGDNLAGASARRGRRTWADFLRENLQSAPAAGPSAARA